MTRLYGNGNDQVECWIREVQEREASILAVILQSMKVGIESNAKGTQWLQKETGGNWQQGKLHGSPRDRGSS